MTVAEWALVISSGSLMISFVALVWNVWSKFVFPKARLSVGFQVMRMTPDPSNFGRFLSLTATNHGPGEITLHSAVVRTIDKDQTADTRLGLINPFPEFPPRGQSGATGPFAGGLPKKLGVGEQFAVYFPFSRETFLKEHAQLVGFHDTFGRFHWCRRKDVKKATAKYEEEFGPVGPKPE